MLPMQSGIWYSYITSVSVIALLLQETKGHMSTVIVLAPPLILVNYVVCNFEVYWFLSHCYSRLNTIPLADFHFITFDLRVGWLLNSALLAEVLALLLL